MERDDNAKKEIQRKVDEKLVSISKYKSHTKFYRSTLKSHYDTECRKYELDKLIVYEKAIAELYKDAEKARAEAQLLLQSIQHGHNLNPRDISTLAAFIVSLPLVGITLVPTLFTGTAYLANTLGNIVANIMQHGHVTELLRIAQQNQEIMRDLLAITQDCLKEKLEAERQRHISNRGYLSQASTFFKSGANASTVITRNIVIGAVIMLLIAYYAYVSGIQISSIGSSNNNNNLPPDPDNHIPKMKM